MCNNSPAEWTSPENHFIRVTPTPSSGHFDRPGVIAHFLVYQFSVFDYIPLLIDYHTNERRSRFALLFQKVERIVSVSLLFDTTRPEHRCRSEAWCLLTYQNLNLEFSESIELNGGEFITLAEITPDPPDDGGSTEQGDDSCDLTSNDNEDSEDDWNSLLSWSPVIRPRTHIYQQLSMRFGDCFAVISFKDKGCFTFQTLIVLDRLLPQAIPNRS